MTATNLEPNISVAAYISRELLHQTGALRVSIAVEATPKGSAAVVEARRDNTIQIYEEDRERQFDQSIHFDHETAITFPDIRQLPPFDVQQETGTVTGTIGGLHHLVDAMQKLVAQLPSRSVLAAEFETTTPQLPIGISCRCDEPAVIMIGDELFELSLENNMF